MVGEKNCKVSMNFLFAKGFISLIIEVKKWIRRDIYLSIAINGFIRRFWGFNDAEGYSSVVIYNLCYDRKRALSRISSSLFKDQESTLSQ